MKFKFRRIHLPTGECWDAELSQAVIDLNGIVNIESFYHLLVRWNRMNSDKWAYAPI
jgi:hypothetical protein